MSSVNGSLPCFDLDQRRRLRSCGWACATLCMHCERVAFGRKSNDEMFGEENDAKARRGPGKHSWMSDNCQGGGFGALQRGSRCGLPPPVNKRDFTDMNVRFSGGTA